MQNFAPNMDVLTPTNSNKQKRFFVPIALVIVLLASLFSFVGSQENANPKPKTVYAADSGGAGHGGQAWCRSQAWVDKITHERSIYGVLWRLGDWLDFVWRMGSKICTPRPTDPPIKLDPKCENPEITVALLVDRSNSVIADGSNITPQLYTQSLNTLIDGFYDRFTPNPRNGHVNFLVYAFGSKSVLQNDTTDNATPVLASNLITDASTPTGRAAMLDTISKIHFRDETIPAYADKNWPNSDTNGFQHSDGSIYQRQRAYNLGSETKGGEYGMTNWHDAFIGVMDAGSSPKYNHPGDAGIGKRIDLAVMVTDGLPTAEDGADWTWTPGTFKGSDTISYNPAADGVDYTDANSVDSWNSNYSMTDDLYRITTGDGGRASAKSAVDMLRTGANPHASSATARNIPARPPISVKGIVVTTNPIPAEQNKSRAYAMDVFGEGNFFFATDFTETLKTQIESLVTDVIDKSNCKELNQPVTTGLTLDISPALIEPLEGDPDGIDVTFIIANKGGGTLRNIRLCFGDASLPGGCNVMYSYGTLELGPGDDNGEYSLSFHAQFGDADSENVYTVIGDSVDEVLDGFSKSPVSDPATLTIHPKRKNLPA